MSRKKHVGLPFSEVFFIKKESRAQGNASRLKITEENSNFEALKKALGELRERNKHNHHFSQH